MNVLRQTRFLRQLARLCPQPRDCESKKTSPLSATLHLLGKSKTKQNKTSHWKKVDEAACFYKTSFRAHLIQIRVPYCSTFFTFALFMKFYQYPNKNLLWEKCSVMKNREPYPSSAYLNFRNHLQIYFFGLCFTLCSPSKAIVCLW